MWRLCLPFLMVSVADAQGWVMTLPIALQNQQRKYEYEDLRNMGSAAIPILEEKIKTGDLDTRLRSADVLLGAKTAKLWEATPIKFSRPSSTLSEAVDTLNSQCEEGLTVVNSNGVRVQTTSGPLWSVIDSISDQSKREIARDYNIGSTDWQLHEVPKVSQAPRAYCGAFRLRLDSVARYINSTVDFSTGKDTTKKLSLKLTLFWEQKIQVLGQTSPLLLAVTDKGHELTEKGRSSSWSYNTSSLRVRDTPISCELESPPFASNRLDKFQVTVPTLICGYFMEHEVDRKGGLGTVGVYEIHLKQAVHHEQNKIWKITVGIDHSIYSDDEQLHQVFIKPCSIYLKKADGSVVEPSNVGLIPAEEKKDIVLGPLETAIDLIDSPPPSQGEYLLNAEFQGLEKVDFDKLIFVYPEVRGRKELVFEFNNVDLPKID